MTQPHKGVHRPKSHNLLRSGTPPSSLRRSGIPHLRRSTNRISSPFKEPISSPFLNPVSSPPHDPTSSPYKDSVASPTQPHHQTSPLSTSSDDGGCPSKSKRRKLQDEPSESHSPELNWPARAGLSHDDSTSEIQSVEPTGFDISATNQPDTSGNDVGGSDVAPLRNFSSSSASSSDLSSDSDSSDSSSNKSDSSSSSSESSSEACSDSDIEHADSDSESEESSLPGLRKVFDRSDLSVDEGVISLMNLFLRRKLEKNLVGDILKDVLKFLPSNNYMPKTQYLLFKHVTDLCPLSAPKVHFYCKECQFYVGEMNETCKLCQSECNKFCQISLAEQIRNLFELHNLAVDILDKFSDQRNNQAEGEYSSISDGSELKKAWCGGRYDLVLHGYTDDVLLSKSSDVYLWPLEFTISQIPLKLRYRFVLICGIWVDSFKPLLNMYLKPFVQELQELYERGVTWTHPQSKRQFTSRVSAPGFCGDAPVRAQGQNISQHVGRYCCNLREQKMVVCRCLETQEKKRVFCMREEECCLRTEERMEKQAKKTKKMKDKTGQDVKPCKGVKGRRILSKIPTCDRSKAVYPEYMHILLGIIKLFAKLWFKTNANDEWSLKAHVDGVNAAIQASKVTDRMRTARSTDHFPKWKASECRSFLLFYSLPVLSNFMKEKYLQHWILFVCAMQLLLQDSVMESDIVKSEILLRMFLRDFSKLYRPQDFTYIMHNLSHLGLTVRLYGPLQESSAFMFESLNGELMNCIHGSKNLVMELTNTLNLFQGIHVLKARVEAKNICPETLIDRKSVELRSFVKNISSGMRTVVSRVNLLSPYHLFYRAVIAGETYTSVSYSRQLEKNNYTVSYVNSQGVKQYGEIICFCQTSDAKKWCF